MSRYRFELATPDDDADLRHVLAATPMAGAVALAFRREPSFFAAAQVDGRFREVIACRDTESGRLVGFGVRSVQERFVNGEPAAVGYLNSLRALPEYRNRGLLARGYADLRRRHADGRTLLYLMTIAEGNAVALAVLTAGRAGLPRCHFAGRYHTIALPLSRAARPRPVPPPGLDVRPARPEDCGAIVDLLRRHGPSRQFFPVYEDGDLFSADGLFLDLRPGDVWLAWRGDTLAGVLAAWDQHRFKQSVVHGYSRALGVARPLVNVWARLRGRHGLPAVGEPFRYRTAALSLAADDGPDVFRALLDAVRAALAGGPDAFLMLGLHESDPLLAAVRGLRARWYTTRLFLACWDDGETLRKGLDGRPPYLELGCL